jgi:FtsH-binding integral membrane protein
MKIKFLFVLMLSLLVLLVTSAFQTTPEWTSLAAVLAWIVTGGGAIVVASSLGALLEANWVTWQNLSAVLKNALVLLFATLLAVGASILLTYTNIVELIQPWWMIVVTVIISWLTGITYWIGKRKGYNQALR